ncbi:MAG: hypothetical protein HXY50_06770 [Ignavibacteriaceae bacterium]|nr:hypothetical protein [Ignavibacteriaceae bacterium]
MKTIFNIAALLLIILAFQTTKAWVYPEHRDIMLRAIQKLEPKHRDVLSKLWNAARIGYESKLTKDVIDTSQSTIISQLDYASWPAIGGDHSTSAKEMLHNIFTTDWLLEVARINAQLKIDLAKAADREERVNALRNSDILLQRADPNYATRAGHNNVHFLLSLKTVKETSIKYGFECVKEGAELNALGVFVWYHYSALLKATRYSTEQLTPEKRSELILALLADEAFALHFLEDVFAAGHTAGTWGDASQKKGTHDYYNEHGLKISTWEGQNLVLTGDAWMRPQDAENAANVVRISIEQVLDAAMGKETAMVFSNEEKIFSADNFDVGFHDYMPARTLDPNIGNLIFPIFNKTPIPGLEHGLGELPRFRAEIGMFVGFVPALRAALVAGGFGKDQRTTGFIGSLESSVRFGAGLDGVLNESGDGLAFLEIGWRQDGSSSSGFVDFPGTESYGNLLAAIPGRSAFSARLRLPFYLVPGDLLVAAPILFLVSQETLIKMGATAVNGGLIPWQAGLATSLGRFQFVLGREVGIYLFGRSKVRDALFNISEDENGIPSLFVLSYRSTQIEFPIVEYRPFRAFEMEQRSSLFIQLYGGIDIPHNVDNITDANKSTTFVPALKPVWYFGARVIFDWRHYF